MGRWSDAYIGEDFGPREFHMSEKLHRRYIDGVHNGQPVHADVVDPSVAGNFAISILGARYPGPIIHTHQELKYFGRVRVGSSVVGRGVLSMKEMRREKAYVAIDCEFQCEDALVWWARMTCIWPEVHLRGEM